MNFFIEHVGKAMMKNYKYFVKKLSIDVGQLHLIAKL